MIRPLRWARLGAWALLGLVPTLGCASGRPAFVGAPLKPARAASLDEVRAAYDGYCRGIETLSAGGDLDVRDMRSGRSQRLGIRMVATRGGRLYLKGSVAIITAIEVVADGQRFWFQVPSKKTVWTGAVGGAPDAERSDAPYYALRPLDVTLAFLPEPLDPQPGELLLLEADRQVFSLILARAEAGGGCALRRVDLDREALAILRTRSYDSRGELVREVSFGSWRDGRPQQVVITRPGEGYVASFALDKFEANVSVPERAFVPRAAPGYKTVEVP